MLIKVTPFEAARILARGGAMWDGCDRYACAVELGPELLRRAGKTRELRRLTRWCARYNYLYLFQKG